jgi:hypothetical protein
VSATDPVTTGRDASVRPVDLTLKVQVIPVSDVDRSTEFYERSGCRLDDDVAPMDGPRIVQFTPARDSPLAHLGRHLHGRRTA